MEIEMVTIESDTSDQYDRASADFLAHFMQFATEQFGLRCEEHEPGCACCDVWKLYDATVKAVDFSGSEIG